MIGRKQNEVEILKKIQKTIKKFSILLGLFMVFLPLPVLAQENSGSIHIEQLDTDTKTPVSGVKLALYKIADKKDNNSYELTEDFQQTSIKVETLCDGDQYEKNVKILDQYIKKNQVKYLQEITSNANGRVSYTGLTDGIYFVRQNNSEQDFERLGYSYKTDSYIVILPGTDENGNFTTNIYCKPKGKIEYPKKDFTIIVYKVWKDENNKTGTRPSKIVVGLYCNEKLQEKVTLNDANNWTYQWKNLDAKSSWEIKEINVPKGYSSKVTKEENTYTITNKKISLTTSKNSKKTKLNAKTGDFSNITFYMIMLIGAIMALIVLVKKKEKKKYS